MLYCVEEQGERKAHAVANGNPISAVRFHNSLSRFSLNLSLPALPQHGGAAAQLEGGVPLPHQHRHAARLQEGRGGRCEGRAGGHDGAGAARGDPAGALLRCDREGQVGVRPRHLVVHW